MPRALIVSSHYPPNFAGGAEVVAHRQAKRLQKLGWEVEVFAGRFDPLHSGKPGAVLEGGVYDGLRVFRVPFARNDLGANFYSREHARLFEQVLGEFAPEVVHCHNIIGLGANLIGAAKRSGAKTIVTLHDYWGFCFKNVLLRSDFSLCEDQDACHLCQALVATPDGNIPVRLRRDFVMSQLQLADAYIAPSRGLGEHYLRAGLDPARIKTFSAGIDVQSFAPRLRGASGVTRFLCSAHLGEHKGLLDLVEAARRLSADENLRGRWRVTIAGRGHLEPRLRALVAEAGLGSAVELSGHLERQALRAELERADVVVLPSIWPENEPVCLLEGLASGAALLASDIGGNAALVEHGENGLTFPPRDPEALADAMRRLIEGPELLEKFSAENLRRREAYDEGAAAEAIAALYEAPVAAHAKREIIVECGVSPPSRATVQSVQTAPQTLAGWRIRFIWWRWRQEEGGRVELLWIWSWWWRRMLAKRRRRSDAPVHEGASFDTEKLGSAVTSWTHTSRSGPISWSV